LRVLEKNGKTHSAYHFSPKYFRKRVSSTCIAIQAKPASMIQAWQFGRAFVFYCAGRDAIFERRDIAYFAKRRLNWPFHHVAFGARLVGHAALGDRQQGPALRIEAAPYPASALL
jgi:hypothetical protein